VAYYGQLQGHFARRFDSISRWAKACQRIAPQNKRTSRMNGYAEVHEKSICRIFVSRAPNHISQRGCGISLGPISSILVVPCTFRMRRTCYLRLKGRQVGEASFFSSGARNRCLLIHVSPSNLCTVTPPQFKVVMWIDLVRAIKSKIASSFHQAPSHLYNSGANTVINNHSLPPLRQSF
jgi:hypothetical protein